MDDMNAFQAPRAPARGTCVTWLVAALLVTACATPEPTPKPEPAPPPPPVVVAPEPPKPVPPPEPILSPAEKRAQAQKLTIDAITQLQNGEAAAAQRMLEQALVLDPASDLAKKMLDQTKADPQKELGTVFFRYTVQRDDSLSKIAQQYLGDRFKFHILARYNDIANPSKLAAGQVIKVPGRGQVAAPPKPVALPADVPEEAAKAVAPEVATPRNAAAALMQQGVQLQKAGNLEGAYDAFREAALRDPGNRDAVLQRDATRQALARRYEREATQAFQRQNLDEAIGKWDRVLALEPGNQKAKLERERAIDLRRKLNEKFGAK